MDYQVHTCPQCGEVLPARKGSRGLAHILGESGAVYFCSDDCKRDYRSNQNVNLYGAALEVGFAMMGIDGDE